MLKERIRLLLKEDGLTILIVLLLVGAYAFLRTPGDTFNTIEDLEQKLIDGKPTIVEFYANNCSICLISKPKIDQLERDLQGQADVIRLNVKEQIGLTLANRWEVRGVPTLFVIDGEGSILYARAGAPDIEAIKENVNTAINKDGKN